MKPIRLGRRMAETLGLMRRGWELRLNTESEAAASRYVLTKDGRRRTVAEVTVLTLESARLIGYESHRPWRVTPAGQQIALGIDEEALDAD